MEKKSSNTAGGWTCKTSPQITVDIDNDNDIDNWNGKTGGLRIKHSELQAWSQAYNAPLDDSNPNVDPLEFTAQCWVGPRSEYPSDDSKLLNMSDEYSGNDIKLTGTLPTRSLDNSDEQTYSCLYGFQQEITPIMSSGGGHGSTFSISPDFQLFKKGDNISTTSTTPGYFVQGRYQIPPIQTTYQAHTVNQIPDTNPDHPTQPWKHYPRGGGGSSGGESRHPLDVCIGGGKCS